jgi:hypothetical protein
MGQSVEPGDRFERGLKALEPDGVSPFMDNGCMPIAVFP